MQIFFRSDKNSKKGITLSELLVVIAIMGIIAALLIPNVLSFRVAAKQRKNMNELSFLIDGYKSSISNMDLSDALKTQMFEYLDLEKLELEKPELEKKDALGAISVHSLGEMEKNISILENKIAILKDPQKFLIAALSDAKIQTIDKLQFQVAKLEIKVDLLSEELLTKWDVVMILFMILGAFVAIITISKLPIFPTHGTRKHIKTRKAQNTKND